MPTKLTLAFFRHRMQFPVGDGHGEMVSLLGMASNKYIFLTEHELKEGGMWKMTKTRTNQ